MSVSFFVWAGREGRRFDGGVPEVAVILLHLFVIFAAAKVGGTLVSRFGQPAVIGELLAGVVIGPFALGLIGNPNEGLINLFHDEVAAREALDIVYEVIAELGVILLLFFVGLETPLRHIIAVGPRAGLVGILGVLAPLGLGYALMTILGWTGLVPLFVGVAIVATSVGITARVLRDLGVIGSLEARIILGAAVIDDILAMIVLAIAAALGTGGSLNVVSVGLIAGQAIAFTAFVALVGSGLMSRFYLHLERLPVLDAPLVVSLALMLGLAALSAQVGLAAIIGAFLAGVVVAEARDHYELEHRTRPIYTFLVPFFFVITGAKVDWRLFLDPQVLGLALLVTAVAVVSKLLACGLGAAGLGVRSIAIIGVGMVPRGEVGLIVASIALKMGVIPNTIFSVIVVMSVLTTLVVPPVLVLLYRDQARGSTAPVPAEAGAGSE